MTIMKWTLNLLFFVGIIMFLSPILGGPKGCLRIGEFDVGLIFTIQGLLALIFPKSAFLLIYPSGSDLLRSRIAHTWEELTPFSRAKIYTQGFLRCFLGIAFLWDVINAILKGGLYGVL